jgi:energy-coupling factor transporter ATP-binding protein EcfA2
MRLKSVWISEYKNLRDFTLTFEGESFLDIFVGKNGTGKSNFFEALVEIFRHIFDSRDAQDEIAFNYDVTYETDGKETAIRFRDDVFTINGREQKTVGQTPVPDNVLVYYSGHNPTINHTVSRYEKRFADQSRSWQAGAARRFIGIRADYKELLLSVLLMQQDSCMARQYLCEKLQIDVVPKQAFKLTLRRPSFASRVQVDVGAADTFLWGAAGTVRDFLNKLTDCIAGGFTFGSIYDREADQYEIPIDLALFRERFGNMAASEIFRSFDQLKAIDMFSGLSVPLRLMNGDVAKVGDFSDGQFQSVYIFAISELFKDRNCMTLLDEPDSFLHPEWQFGFLKQVVDITGTDAAKTNHVLLSSHSASTISKSQGSEIRMFELGENGVSVTVKDKATIVKSLSAGLITFSEKEAKLSIYEVLENTTDAVLFTEGLSDKIILDAAIEKLFPGEKIGVVVQGAFDRIFLRNLFSRDELRKNYKGRSMFALFDFDEAFNDWDGLKHCEMVQEDPFLGLGKRLNHKAHCAFLLPVPNHETLRRQALTGDGQPFKDGSACLPIELLFCDPEKLGDHFSKKEVMGGGEVIRFSGDKVSFAKHVSKNFSAKEFECFRPLLEFARAEASS